MTTNLDVFSFKQLQDFLPLALAIQREEITVSAIVEYIETRKQSMRIATGKAKRNAAVFRRRARRQTREWAKVADKCPTCKAPMILIAVNTSKRNNIGGSWKSMWQCPVLGCEYSDLRYTNIEQELIRVGWIKKEDKDG